MATNVKRKKKAEVMEDDGSMTLTGHLKELRNRLIICAVVFVVSVVITLMYADRLIDILTAMGQGYYTFVSIAPQEKLMQYFRVSLLAAFVITVPVALYQIYAFAKPGLKKSETFFLKLVILMGLALFCVGVLFAYKLMMPFMLRFLSTGIEGADYIFVSGHSAGGYLSLILAMDKKYLAAYGADADSVAAYLPVSGQTVTHFTIRKERGLPDGIPVVDEYAPVNKARKETAPLVLITGDKHLEMAARYEENALLEAVLKSIGNKKVTLYEMQGFDHGQVLGPACCLIADYVKRFK